MAAIKGTCVECGRKDISLPAHSMCHKCYNELYPPSTRKHKCVNKENHGEYPKKIMIPSWETSDGKEWGMEVDALRHQLELERIRKVKPYEIVGGE